MVVRILKKENLKFNFNTIKVIENRHKNDMFVMDFVEFIKHIISSKKICRQKHTKYYYFGIPFNQMEFNVLIFYSILTKRVMKKFNFDTKLKTKS